MKISSRDLELLRLKHPKISTKEYLKDISRLVAGEPIDYVLGNSEFLGMTIDLSYKPLIPRVETEYWVEKAIEENKDRKRPDVLDIFSGSGCIGVAVGKRLKTASVQFADSEDNCLRQIRKNIKLNRLKSRTRVIKSDILKSIKGKFDIIFANPPYIPNKRKKKLPESVVRYELGKYLFAGDDGLQIIKRFITTTPQHLKPGGVVYLEFDAGQQATIRKIFKKVGMAVEIRKDQYGRYRFAKAWTKE